MTMSRAGKRKRPEHRPNLAGRSFGVLTVLRDTGQLNHRQEVLWLCQCICGNQCEAITKHLLAGLKKSCGCLRGRKTTTNHNNRDCREALLIALYAARRWQIDLVIYFSYYANQYLVRTTKDNKRAGYQVGYRVSPDGTVVNYPGYPDKETLLKELV